MRKLNPLKPTQENEIQTMLKTKKSSKEARIMTESCEENTVICTHLDLKIKKIKEKIIKIEMMVMINLGIIEIRKMKNIKATEVTPEIETIKETRENTIKTTNIGMKEVIHVIKITKGNIKRINIKIEIPMIMNIDEERIEIEEMIGEMIGEIIEEIVEIREIEIIDKIKKEMFSIYININTRLL